MIRCAHLNSVAIRLISRHAPAPSKILDAGLAIVDLLKTNTRFMQRPLILINGIKKTQAMLMRILPGPIFLVICGLYYINILL